VLIELANLPLAMLRQGCDDAFSLVAQSSINRDQPQYPTPQSIKTPVKTATTAHQQLQ
jgi:hypothetical protein